MKTVIIGANIPFRGEVYFAFEYNGNVRNKDAVRDAIWDALNEELYLAPPEIIEQEYVDSEYLGTKISWSIEKGTADDYRVPEKQLTKDQLWRRVARLAGELAFSSQYSIPFTWHDGLCASESVLSLIKCVRSFDILDSIDKTRHEKIITKLEAALAAWEAAK